MISQDGLTKHSYCSTTPTKVISTGYWHELCIEKDDPLYYAHLYNSEQVYLALLTDSKFYKQILSLCGVEALTKYTFEELYDESKWEFRLP